MQYCSYIYFIFVSCIIIQINCSIERENGTEIEPLADVISREKCNSNVTLCSCDDMQNLMDGSNGFMELACLDFKKHIEFGVYKSAYLPAGILPGFHIAVMSLDHPKVNVNENIFEAVSSIFEFKVYQSNIQVIIYFPLNRLTLFVFSCILKFSFH